MIRVADYIAKFIYKHKVSHVFMLSGGGSIFLDDGVACHKKLKAICVRNEASAPMMAEAYAKITGNIGVVYVTTGPGGANAVSGLTEAWVDSAPVLVISGQVQSNHATYNIGIDNLRTFGTQELNIIKVVESITKYAVMVNHPEEIRYHLEKAFYLAKDGRPGPVWLDIPLDVQSAQVDENKLAGYKPPNLKQCIIVDNKIGLLADKVIELLRSAKRPLIVAGQGVRIANAVKHLRELLETLDVPIIFSRMGQDILEYSHKNNFGHGGIKGLRYTGFIMKESDFILSLGCRLSVQFVGINFDAFSPESKIAVVDIDEAELSKPGVPIDLPILSDAGTFIKELLARIKGKKLPLYKDWMDKCQGYKDSYPLIRAEHKKNPIDLYYFVDLLDKLSGKDDIFVSDAGSSYYVAGQALTFKDGQREITSGAFASMGLAIPLAIGCSVADNNKQILAITGDGSLELNIQELKTVSYYGLNIKLFVINNGGYVSIRNTQDNVCSSRYIGSDSASGVETLNLRKVADAFGLAYSRIDRHQDIRRKLKSIMLRPGPIFVEVVCDRNQKIIESIKDDIRMLNAK
ncbi:MAG: thiamine pyrophosphate-binding protein [Candidatus Omnitrophica bacterium]|jgi:acetolactate synthase-1/2/3 large subunit|nr:thiamine pyrophosphate-binding protein [Candidatus Omnitrophota bacterium]